MSDRESKPKRAPPLSIRPPGDMRAVIEEKAAQAGLSVNRYVLSCVLQKMPRSTPAEAARRLSDLALIWDAFVASDPEGAAAHADEFDLLRDFLMRAGGKR